MTAWFWVLVILFGPMTLLLLLNMIGILLDIIFNKKEVNRALDYLKQNDFSKIEKEYERQLKIQAQSDSSNMLDTLRQLKYSTSDYIDSKRINRTYDYSQTMRAKELSDIFRKIK